MKIKIILATLIISTFASLHVNAQENAQDGDGLAKDKGGLAKDKEEVSKASILNTRFGNLEKEKRIKYLTLRAEAHRFFANKRIFETLMTLYDMREIFEEDPVAYNLRGAIHVELRDFAKAREVFEKAVDLAGEDPKILFNLAELEFCDNQWISSIKNFELLLQKIKAAPDSDFKRLIEFKILLCKLALSKDDYEDATDDQKKEYLAEAKELAQKYSPLVDSPFYYYANSALAFYEDDKGKASEWIITAKRVFFNNPGLVTSWDDTMVEYGYITAHYGKHFSDSEESK